MKKEMNRDGNVGRLENRKPLVPDGPGEFGLNRICTYNNTDLCKRSLEEASFFVFI
jgi:hypothetical protein